MLDTNVFNDALDAKISANAFTGRCLLVTDIQEAELRATGQPRKEALLTKFWEINATVLLASSFAWDIEGAGWDNAEWNDGSGNFEKMLEHLRQLDKKSRKSSRNLHNQARDILIAETAIKNNAVLVSGDKNLRRTVREFGGCAIDPEEFQAEEES